MYICWLGRKKTVWSLVLFSSEFFYFIGILQGIASGTLLYVTFLEILERERAKKKISGLVKLLAFFLGFVLLLLVEVLGELI